MPLTPQVTITANLQQITGSVDAASAVFELVNFGSTVPRVSGTCLILQISTTAVANGSGNISVTLWGNDVITPSGTYYTVTYYDDGGGQIASVGYQFVGSGSFDLSTLIPLGEQVVANQQPNSAIPAVFNPITHEFLTGMNSVGSFSAAQPAFSDLSGTIAATQLIVPTASTLGGVKSLAAVSHQFLTSIGTDGLPVAAQPSFSDISGTVASAQLSPGTASTLGGVATQIVVAHNFMTGINTSGFATIARPSAADLSDTATTGNVLRGNGTSFVSAQLAAADLSNGVTGSGAIVLATSPTLTTPTIGVATGTTLALGTTPAASGTLRLPSNTSIAWRNNANTGDILLTKNASDQFTIGTTTVPNATDTLVGRATTDTLTNKTIGSGGLAGLTVSKQIFTSSGTFTIPTGVTSTKVTVVGAGGGGAGSNGSSGVNGLGGNSGASTIKWLSGLTPGNTLTVTVGAAGSAGSAGSNAGGAGGNSSISSGTQTISTVTANGGAGGAVSGSTSSAPSTSSGGDINSTGAISIQASTANTGGTGASSIFGGGAQGGFAATGNAATTPGAGGGGAGGGGAVAVAGGAGAAGIVIFEWMI